jgi:hypothetical protein
MSRLYQCTKICCRGRERNVKLLQHIYHTNKLSVGLYVDVQNNYDTTVVTTASMQMSAQLSYDHRHYDLNTDVNENIIRSLSTTPL